MSLREYLGFRVDGRPGELSPTSMGSLAYQEDYEEEKNSAFTWEVKANSRAYNSRFKEKVFLCWRRRKYKTNIIRTAKYNVFSFLPLNLYEQFHRMSNIYFLLVIILQAFPEISTLPWFTLFAPFVCLLLIRATRDLVDDIGRHRNDRIINNRPCQILQGKRFLWRRWMNICVGDLVCLHKDSIVPADLLLLASTEPSSLCYVETADIDGETNLKFRQAPMVTHHELTSMRMMECFQEPAMPSAPDCPSPTGKVVCEEPNSRMHHFVGCLEWKGKKYPLDSGNILLRGCKIRNTDTCYGMVIYAGFDTKIMKNCGKFHLKRTKIDLLVNKLVLLVQIFLSLVLISAALTLGFWYQVQEFKAHYYVSHKHAHGVLMETFLIFWGFLILLSAMVPMALFIIAEFIYLGNSVFINWDEQMYYEPKDLPAMARSTSLNDQLGQVEYIFSDKTGTLTQNIMTFKKCCIEGCVYGPDAKSSYMVNPYLWNKFADGKLLFYNAELLHAVQSKKDKMVQEFWRLLAICHTVMVQEKGNQLLYQAASPDEEALVTAARNFGYVFLSRTQDSITVMELGKERVYKVLAMMDFNSVRKRMSVLVRNPEGTIYLYTKGADTVIFERLYRKGEMEWTTEEALASFAQETLRTLCLAYKEVDEDTYEHWHRRHQEASILLQNRAQALHQVYEEMEQDLQLLGVTAIEDKLQDGVPETIQCLKQGNIKVWVLTGDKQETAVNIGFACQLLSENMLILEEKEIVRSRSQILETYWEKNNNLRQAKGRAEDQASPKISMAMVISGDLLDQLFLSLRKEPRVLIQSAEESWQELGEQRADFLQARRVSQIWQLLGMQHRSSRLAPQDQELNGSKNFEAQRERAFVSLALKCQAVICCRVTPKQKALIVALVKKYQNVVTLAIGDGANDVNMIKSGCRAAGPRGRTAGGRLGPMAVRVLTAADIGVGLAGQEGMQAVQNSDYVLAQFCFLQRLLLVHGRWSYMRVCKFLRYFIYKTIASMMGQVWFAFYSGFSAQPLYEGWFLALFNLLYSTLPVLFIGLFEQDVSAERSLQLPELYMAGQKDELFNYRVFFQAIAHGMFTSVVNFFMTLWLYHDMASPASPGDYQSFTVVMALSSLLSITVEVGAAHAPPGLGALRSAGPAQGPRGHLQGSRLPGNFSLPGQVILIIKYWTVLSVLAILLSLSAYVVMTWATQSFWLFRISPTTFSFLCEPPGRVLGGGARCRPGLTQVWPHWALSRPLRLWLLSGDLHRAPWGHRARPWCGTQSRFWKALSRLRCDPALSPDADRNVLTHPFVLLVVLLNVSLNTLPVLALRVIYHTLTKPRPKVEVEAPPSEEIITVEPAHYLQREARGRRSSYAFSHREGYADLITQGTILRRTPGANSMLADPTMPMPYEEEPTSSQVEPSRWHSRRASLLGRKHRHRSMAHSDDLQPASVPGVGSSSLTGSPSYLENQFSISKNLPPTPEWQAGPMQENSSTSTTQEAPAGPKH
ncbi:Phospholipid-transporting ATPase IK [Galemys pyrenaicus]|uniref:Phospholipid-transporting ATPase n=1 Tax=Galemys pyrenaicus TaxID=202257 RepID=A0A8J6AIW8_GALPY|nr:Phospholipid-transporting ATPase IK [Galemys pyrenaicus]